MWEMADRDLMAHTYGEDFFICLEHYWFSSTPLSPETRFQHVQYWTIHGIYTTRDETMWFHVFCGCFWMIPAVSVWFDHRTLSLDTYTYVSAQDPSLPLSLPLSFSLSCPPSLSNFISIIWVLHHIFRHPVALISEVYTQWVSVVRETRMHEKGNNQ